MNPFEKEVLSTLLDKYEKSKLSKGGTSVSRKIKLDTGDSVLSTYNGYDSYKYADENDEILKSLEGRGFIKTRYDGDVFVSLTLVLESVDDIYAYLGRKKPKDELSKIILVLNKYRFGNFVDDFIDFVRSQVETRYSFPKIYFNDADQLDFLLRTLKCLLSLTEDIKKREFSAKYLGDSKVFENNEGKIIKILKDFDGNDYISDDDVLASYNIVKNSSYALVKNKLSFKINECVVDLDSLGFEFSLSDEMIKNLDVIPTKVTKVITIENLTTFYSYEDREAVIVYLAGFHNHTKQELLKKIYTAYPNASYYHHGDIDAGGFWIFKNLRDKTGISFSPLKMGMAELIENSDHLKPLTGNDRLRLAKMVNDPSFGCFKKEIEYMLEHNVKLEQEVLD